MARHHPAPRGWWRRRGPRRGWNWECPSRGPTGCNCASRPVEWRAVPATPAVGRQFRAKSSTCGTCGAANFSDAAACPQTMPSAASTSVERDGSRCSVAAGNSSRRLASASAEEPRQSQPAKPALRGSHNHPTKGRKGTSPADLLAAPTLGKAGRRHAQRCALVGAAGRTESGVIDGIGHRISFFQRTAQRSRAQRPLILQRTHAHLLLESRCTVNGLRPASRPNSASGTGRSAWVSMWARILSKGLFAAAATGRQRLQGRKPAACASVRGEEELHIGAQRPAAGAAGAAEDAGGYNRIEKRGGGIAAENLLPSCLRIEAGVVSGFGIAVHENHSRRLLGPHATRFLRAIRNLSFADR